MLIHLKLYSILREKLPLEAKGQADVTLEEGGTLADLLDQFGIDQKVVISVNGLQERDQSRSLEDGDEVKIFASISGG